jgi:N-acetyl-D-muramate 6-phosphate phosphatase
MLPSLASSVLFDLDGTLADTAPDLAYALNTLLAENGKEALPLDMLRPVVSLGGVAMVRQAFEIEEGHSDFAALKERFLQLYRNNIAKYTVLFEGMENLLTQLEARQIPWGIVTNKSTWLTQALMQELDLATRTPCIVCGDTVEYAKPHPAPMLHACRLLECVAEQTVYIGDAMRDIEAGNRAQMTTLIANYGYIGKDEQTKKWGANGNIDSPLEILNWVI